MNTTIHVMTCQEFLSLGQYPSHYNSTLSIDDLNEESGVFWDGNIIYDKYAEITTWIVDPMNSSHQYPINRV